MATTNVGYSAGLPPLPDNLVEQIRQAANQLQTPPDQLPAPVPQDPQVTATAQGIDKGLNELFSAKPAEAPAVETPPAAPDLGPAASTTQPTPEALPQAETPQFSTYLEPKPQEGEGWTAKLKSFFTDPATISATIFGLGVLNSDASNPAGAVLEGMGALGSAYGAQRQRLQQEFQNEVEANKAKLEGQKVANEGYGLQTGRAAQKGEFQVSVDKLNNQLGIEKADYGLRRSEFQLRQRELTANTQDKDWARKLDTYRTWLAAQDQKEGVRHNQAVEKLTARAQDGKMVSDLLDVQTKLWSLQAQEDIAAKDRASREGLAAKEHGFDNARTAVQLEALLSGAYNEGKQFGTIPADMTLDQYREQYLTNMTDRYPALAPVVAEIHAKAPPTAEAVLTPTPAPKGESNLSRRTRIGSETPEGARIVIDGETYEKRGGALVDLGSLYQNQQPTAKAAAPEPLKEGESRTIAGVLYKNVKGVLTPQGGPGGGTAEAANGPIEISTLPESMQAALKSAKTATYQGKQYKVSDDGKRLEPIK